MSDEHIDLRDRFAIAALPACIEWLRLSGRDELIGDGEPEHAQPVLPDGEIGMDEPSAAASAAYLFADAMLARKRATDSHRLRDL